jgi:hypothetical protein
MTKHKPGTLEALAEVLAQRVIAAQGSKARMHVVAPHKPDRQFESARRESCARQRRLRITYRLNGQLSPAVFSIPGVAPLTDIQLSRLQADIERNNECTVESISYEIASLQQSPALEMREGCAA